jgi:beta-glucanase (GH16 family)
MCILLLHSMLFAQTPANAPHWKLNWEDQFNTFDNTKWKIIHNCDHYSIKNNVKIPQPQLYIEQNVWVSNGNLVIKVDNTKAICPNPPPSPMSWCCGSCVPGQHNYSSGWVETTYPNYNTKFGYIEARIKFPFRSGKEWGFWPAFWVWRKENNNPPAVKT